MKKILSFGLIIIILLSACNKVKENSYSSKKEINKIEEFQDFFNKFSTDSVFRISRIIFPLNGFNSDETNLNAKDKPYKWEKENWLFYASEDFAKNESKDVKKTELLKNDSTIIYRIYKEDSGYDVQYSFKLEKDKWCLINYSYKDF